jgi:hypothetical protein
VGFVREWGQNWVGFCKRMGVKIGWGFVQEWGQNWVGFL